MYCICLCVCVCVCVCVCAAHVSSEKKRPGKHGVEILSVSPDAERKRSAAFNVNTQLQSAGRAVWLKHNNLHICFELEIFFTV